MDQQNSQEKRSSQSLFSVTGIIDIIISEWKNFIFIVIIPTLLITFLIYYKNSQFIYSTDIIKAPALSLEKTWELENHLMESFRKEFYPHFTLKQKIPFEFVIDKGDAGNITKSSFKEAIVFLNWFFLRSKVEKKFFEDKDQFKYKFLENVIKSFFMEDELFSLNRTISYELSDKGIIYKKNQNRLILLQDQLNLLQEVKKKHSEKGISYSNLSFQINNIAETNPIHYFSLEQQTIIIESEMVLIKGVLGDLEQKIAHLISIQKLISSWENKFRVDYKNYDKNIKEFPFDQIIEITLLINEKRWVPYDLIDMKNNISITLVPSLQQVSILKETLKLVIVVTILLISAFITFALFRKQNKK